MEVSDQHSYVTRRHKTKRKGEVEFSEVHLQTPTFSSFSTAKRAKARYHCRIHLLPTAQPCWCSAKSCFQPAGVIDWPPCITCPHTAGPCPHISLAASYPAPHPFSRSWGIFRSLLHVLSLPRGWKQSEVFVGLRRQKKSLLEEWETEVQ